MCKTIGKTINVLDLHMHSDISDGTDTPEEIIGCVRRAGIELFSVTDHDAILAAQLIPGYLKAGDPAFLPGVEFSCRNEKGKYHILGYGYDASASPIRDVVEKGHQLRMKKTRARMDFLTEEFGFEFSKEDVDALLMLHNPGKPHIGNLMVRYGYAESIKDAINRFINKRPFPDAFIMPEEAITAILQSGGIPVLAHPSYGSGEELIVGEEMDRRLQDLIDMGIRGVEAYYSGFSAKLQEEILQFALKYHLFVTAGSDYHGGNKLVILGDTNLDCVQNAAPGLKAFLEAVNSRIVFSS